MVTFSRLGNFGRLGNQLFQISAVLSYSLKNKNDYFFKNWDYNEFLKTPLKISNIDSTRFYQHRERGPFFVSSIPVVENIDLIGYFQNYEYFNEYKKEILDILEPKDWIIKFIDDVYSNLPSRKTSIHVRRGDYVNLSSHHPVLSVDYYKDAVNALNNETDIFIIFSDDIDWCIENLNFIDRSFIFPRSNEFVEMIAMSKCQNHIIANSSFSWWGSYICNEIKTIAPRIWLGPSYRGTDYSGVYRKNMEIL